MNRFSERPLDIFQTTAAAVDHGEPCGRPNRFATRARWSHARPSPNPAEPPTVADSLGWDARLHRFGRRSRARRWRAPPTTRRCWSPRTGEIPRKHPAAGNEHDPMFDAAGGPLGAGCRVRRSSRGLATTLSRRPSPTSRDRDCTEFETLPPACRRSSGIRPLMRSGFRTAVALSRAGLTLRYRTVLNRAMVTSPAFRARPREHGAWPNRPRCCRAIPDLNRGWKSSWRNRMNGSSVERLPRSGGRAALVAAGCPQRGGAQRYDRAVLDAPRCGRVAAVGYQHPTQPGRVVSHRPIRAFGWTVTTTAPASAFTAPRVSNPGMSRK